MTTTSTPTRHVRRPGGRLVAFHDLTPDAPPDAPMVLISHVAPGSGTFDPDAAATAAAGVRLVGVDRPGYGGSDPVVDAFATVGAAADDAAAVLDELLPPGGTAGVAGWSAGGRVALALAARRPDLVGRVALIGTPAPDEQVPWIPDEHRAGIDALRGAPAAVAHAALGEAFGGLAELPADVRLGLIGAGPADAATLGRPGVTVRLSAMLDAAFAAGTPGLVADIAGYCLAPWGFAPGDVRAPVLLVYGEADGVAGPAHGRWWRAALPQARLDARAGQGHLVVVPAWAAVLAHLAGPR
ncbi:MAG TPA: alpha/beta hydrolase [Pseudonocardia sp.]|jgi:pimeloyl-ACP methyl ester carboxylesterase|nr:alpha/beta hydrolase [Pseudonocardia sp.]